MAPEAKLSASRCWTATARGKTSDVLAAIEFARANKAKLGIDVINLSLGHPILEPAATDPLVQAVEAAVRAGIVVVCSAGNIGINPDTGEPGYAGITSPGNAPSAHHGRRDRHDGHRRAQRRPRRALQLARPDAGIDGYAKPDMVAPGHRDDLHRPPQTGICTRTTASIGSAVGKEQAVTSS